jgi:hypothetical protein
MAKNPPPGDPHRVDAVCERSQAFNPHTHRRVKRDADTGRFMDHRSNNEPLKGVRKEK